MSDRAALVAGIAARPGADFPRLVLADWLDDHGQPERAAFVRHRVAAARLAPGAPARLAELAAADALEATHDAEWLGEWRGRLVDWEFRRGFVYSARITLANWLAHANELFDWEPVAELTIVNDADEGLSGEEVRAAVGHPAFARVRAVKAERHRGARRGPGRTRLVAAVSRAGPARHPPAGRRSVRRGCRAGYRLLRVLRGVAPAAPAVAPAVARPERRVAEARPQRRPGPRPVRPAPAPPRGHGGHRLAARDRRGAVPRTPLALAVGDDGGDPDSRRRLYASPNLANLRAITIDGPDPLYAASPLARRSLALDLGWCGNRFPQSPGLVRELVGDVARMVRRRPPRHDERLPPRYGREQWAEFVRRVRTPRSLAVGLDAATVHVPELIAEAGWLRRCRELRLIAGDEEDPRVAAAVQRLFAPLALPRLARLALSGADPEPVLRGWGGAGQLEYCHTGRLSSRCPASLAAEFPRAVLGAPNWIAARTEADLARLAPVLHLATRLELNFGLADAVSPAAADAFLAALDPRRLRSLELYFGYGVTPAVDALLRRLANPAVLPGLKRLKVYCLRDGDIPAALTARFHPRRLGF